MTLSLASPDGPATDGPRERPVPEPAHAFCGGSISRRRRRISGLPVARRQVKDGMDDGWTLPEFQIHKCLT
jgi:hypothetical protein